MQTIKSIILIFFLIGLSSCNKNKKILEEDFINLYPNKALIKKQYNRYWTFNPFYPEDSLFTPITKSKKRPNMPLGLIKGSDIYNLENFYKYVENNLDGNYTAYIYSHDKPIYRYFLKIYKDDQKRFLTTNQEIEEYFKKNKIRFEYLNKEDQKHAAFLLNEKNTKESAFCYINSKQKILEIFLTYNISDTIKSLRDDSFRPYSGSEIEN